MVEQVIDIGSSPVKKPFLKIDLDIISGSKKESSKKQSSSYYANTGRDTVNTDAMINAKEKNFATVERALVSAKAKEAVLHSMRFFPSFKKSNVTSNQKYMETVRDKEKNRDKDDGKSDAGKSQYQSVYKIGELQDKGMFIHDLLASEYDNENVAVTKTKLKQQESL